MVKSMEKEMDKDFLDWAERLAQRRIEFQSDAVDSITEQANKSLQVGLLMASGCLAGFSTFIESRLPLATAFLATAIWLVIPCVTTVVRVLSGYLFNGPGHDPEPLLECIQNASTLETRQAVFERTQEKITENRLVCVQMARNLYQIHGLLILSPLVVAAAWAAGEAVWALGSGL